MELAIGIWESHIEVFKHFDLVCNNGHSLEDETKTNALFNALVTLEEMYKYNDRQLTEIEEAIDYLKGSKYYSENNKDSKY
jgi:hypothetical protein